MFEHLASYPRIVVTGPQRSGTTIASRMIAEDTGHDLVDESAFGVYDVDAWRAVLERENVVVQCPHMLRLIVDEARPDLLVVLMRRSLAEVHASERRIEWEQRYRGNSVELSVFGLTEGSSAEVKYAYWDTHPKPPRYLEIPYDALADHPRFVAAGARETFGRKQTAPVPEPATPGRQIDEGLREWLATCRFLGIDDEQVVRTGPGRYGVSREAIERELVLLEGRSADGVVRAGQRLGFRLRKLEALMHARAEADRSRVGPGVDQLDSLDESVLRERYWGRNLPVVVNGLAARWPAMSWTPELLAARCGPALVRPESLSFEDGPAYARRLRISAFLEAVTRQRPEPDEVLAVDPNGMSRVRPSLLDDLAPLPSWLVLHDVSACRMALEPAGVATRLHYEPRNALHVQLRGRAMLTLHAPDQTPLLYNVRGPDSEVDPDAPDRRRHPAYATSAAARLTLHPGQALFVPVGWWHHRRNLDPTIAVEFTGFTLPNHYPRLDSVARLAAP